MYTDEALALQLIQGDKGALQALVNRHHSPLLGFLYRMTGGDRALAEDLTQEAFLRALRGIAGYHYPRPFKPWLYQIATNLARDHYKRAEVRQVISMPEDEWAEVGDAAPRPEDALLLVSEARQVVAALRRLPDHQREAVILRYYQDFSLTEIAEALTIPVGTVKSRLSLGIARLRETLLEEER